MHNINYVMISTFLKQFSRNQAEKRVKQICGKYMSICEIERKKKSVVKFTSERSTGWAKILAWSLA